MKIHVTNVQKALPINKKLVFLLTRELFSYLNISCDEIAFHFISEQKSSALHEQFFQDPAPTDCMTFPIDARFLGEVLICPAVAIAYSKKREIDPYSETMLYLIHGVLHLIGHDDLEPKKRRKMRKIEKRCMSHLKTRGISLGSISP